MRATKQNTPSPSSSSLIYMSLWLIAAGAAIAYIASIVNNPEINAENKYAAFIPKPPVSQKDAQLNDIKQTLSKANTQLTKLNNNYYVLETKLSSVEQAISELDGQKQTLAVKVNQLQDTLGSVTGALGNTPRTIKTKETRPLQKTALKPKIPAKTIKQIPLPILLKDQKTAKPQLLRTHFAITLGNYASINHLKTAWKHLSTKHKPLLGPLSARYLTIVVDNHPRYKLVTGPIKNALDAAKMCTQLQQANIACAQTTYQGTDI